MHNPASTVVTKVGDNKRFGLKVNRSSFSMVFYFQFCPPWFVFAWLENKRDFSRTPNKGGPDKTVRHNEYSMYYSKEDMTPKSSSREVGVNCACRCLSLCPEKRNNYSRRFCWDKSVKCLLLRYTHTLPSPSSPLSRLVLQAKHIFQAYFTKRSRFQINRAISDISRSKEERLF